MFCICGKIGIDQYSLLIQVEHEVRKVEVTVKGLNLAIVPSDTFFGSEITFVFLYTSGKKLVKEDPLKIPINR